jgi:PKD repeat protein
MNKFLLIFLAGFNLAISQTVALKPFQTEVVKGTDEHLKKYDLLKFDARNLVNQIDDIEGNVKEITLRTPSNSWQLVLFEYSLIDPNWVRNTGAPGQVKRLPVRKDIRTFTGTIKGQNSMVSVTVSGSGFFKIMIDDRKERYFIEPLDLASLSSAIPADQQFISYKSSDIIPTKGVMCGADYVEKETEKRKQDLQNRAAPPCKLCAEVKICLAADYTMYLKYGMDVLKVEDQMISILADVQTVFDDEFQHEYQYQVTGTWVADDLMRDPWLGVRDINTQLDIFTNVAPQIFSGSQYNVATNWTAKYITGVIGLAYLSVVCMNTPFNVCSDFLAPGGRQGDYLTLQAHELGHNWSMQHDANIAPTIMAPIINGSRQWSAASVFSLNNYVTSYKLIETQCLTKCPNSDAPFPAFTADVTYGCQPVVIHFQDQSLYTSNWKWTFPGGNPSTSTDQHPIVTYRTPGKYEVSLEAGNQRCKILLTKVEYIEINDVPVPDFQFGINTDREVFFTNYSQRGVDYIWKFGDGEESEDQNPTHVFPRDTTYEVTLIVANDCGVRSIKKKISVVSLPTANFDSDTTWGCASKVIQFFDRSTNNVIKWIWSFPGGSPSFSNAINPFVRYDLPGTYDVELTVLSAKSSNKMTKKIYITIDSLPDAEFTYNILGGNQVSFSNQSRYSKSHYWDFGDNVTSTEANPTHSYLEGRYEILYIVKNSCGNDTAKTIITVGSKPIAGFQVNNARGCLPFQVQFQNTSTAAATAYRWYFPGGNPSTSTAKDPLITYNTVGKYQVSLYAYNNFFSDSIGINDFIEVKDEPTAAFTNTITGFKSFFSHQAVGATNYFWDFGDGRASFEENPVHDYQVEGEFDVKFIVQNECGQDTFEKHIAVYLVPKVNYGVDTIRGCAPLTVHFIDKSSIDVTSWDWQFEGGTPSTSTEKNPVITFNKKGRYTVKLSVANTNGTNALTRPQYIQVLSPVLCPEHTKTGAFMLTSDNPFGVNLEERSKYIDQSIPFVFPNPAQDHLYVYTGCDASELASVEVFDLSGRRLSRNESNEPLFMIQTSELRVGTYYVKILNGTGSSVCKFVIAE